MKKILNSILVATFFLLGIFTISTTTTKAANPVDELKDYTITVDVRKDGTLDIFYDLTWHVVEDDGEPLTYVDFGIPNKHVDEIKSRSRETIDRIEFTDDYHNSDGSYVKILLKEKYYKDSYIHMAFSIHQSYMYRILDDEKQLRYNFTPGWFDKMKIEKLTIKWNANQAQSASDGYKMNGNYIQWEKENLDEGERFPITVYYDIEAWDVSKDEQADEDGLNIGTCLIVILIIIIGVIVILGIVCIFIDDDYSSGSGYGGGHYYHSSCAHSSCAHSSCACACACAGGGRAGCSRKDFYRGRVNIEKLNKVLSDEKSR